MTSLKYITGDLFIAPTHSILAHSCNTHGIWGGGIAYQFALKYPKAERLYEEHCAKHKPYDLLGTTLLLKSDDFVNDGPNKKGYYIACLFTSVGGGNSPDAPDAILLNTRAAIHDLFKQLQESEDPVIQGLRNPAGRWVINLPKINAGIFRVPWDHTSSILQGTPYELDFNVYII
jgi:ADP-ribose 1''-phosphate phosphatase